MRRLLSFRSTPVVTVTLADETHVLGAGSFLQIPPRVLHGYRNEGAEPVRLLCTIPAYFGYHTVIP